MKKLSRFRFILFLVAVLGISCSTQATTHNPQDVWVTVYVHGTLMPHWTLSDIFKMVHGNVHNTTYGRYLRQFRSTPFFFKNQAIQGLGLRPIHMNQQKPVNASQALAHIHSRMHEKYDKTQSGHRYYTYGWSGLLNDRARQKTAKAFYTDLMKEVERLKNTIQNPVKVRLIGYSHGGNLIMNIPEAFKDMKNPLCVDEAVLLGTPIQNKTYAGVNPRFFKKIYNVYSLGDRVQNMDCISGTNAQRTFSWQKVAHPELIRQVRFRFNRRQRPALDSDDRMLPHKQVNPGHIELWFFGWDAHHYRDRFPVYPFPAIGMIPYILHLAKEFQHAPSMTVEISPNAGQASARLYDVENNQTGMHLKPFLSQQERHTLHKEVKKLRPHQYRQQYKQRLERILRKIRKTTM